MNKYLHTVASVGFLFTLNYDARNHELKKKVTTFLSSGRYSRAGNATAVFTPLTPYDHYLSQHLDDRLYTNTILAHTSTVNHEQLALVTYQQEIAAIFNYISFLQVLKFC